MRRSRSYGYFGEANPNDGFRNNIIRSISPTYATIELRDNVEKSVKESGRVLACQGEFESTVTGEELSFWRQHLRFETT